MKGPRRDKRKKLGSIKDRGGMRIDTGPTKKDNLGKLMRKHRYIEEALYTHTANTDMVFEDMDFSIEEFSEITGCDLDELMEDIRQAMKKR